MNYPVAKARCSARYRQGRKLKKRAKVEKGRVSMGNSEKLMVNSCDGLVACISAYRRQKISVVLEFYANVFVTVRTVGCTECEARLVFGTLFVLNRNGGRFRSNGGINARIQSHKTRSKSSDCSANSNIELHADYLFVEVRI